RDRDRDDAIPTVLLDLRRRAEEDEPGSSIRDRPAGFRDDRGLGARAGEPSADPSVGRDDGAGPDVSRGRRAPPHHRGDGVGLTARREFPGYLQDVDRHADSITTAGPTTSRTGSPPRPSPTSGACRCSALPRAGARRSPRSRTPPASPLWP